MWQVWTFKWAFVDEKNAQVNLLTLGSKTQSVIMQNVEWKRTDTFVYKVNL